MKPINILGLLIGIVSMLLAWIWFDWRLCLVIILALTSNNLERTGRFKKEIKDIIYEILCSAITTSTTTTKDNNDLKNKKDV